MIPEPKGLRCYATLGVSPHADSNALRSAFRRLAFQKHPDRNNNAVGATEEFQHLKEIWDYLSNDACRKHYDQIVGAAYTRITLELDQSYRKLHEVRRKICQSQTHHTDPATDVGGHHQEATSDMNKESQLLEQIKAKLQDLADLNGEIRQVPDFTRYTDVGVPGAVDFWRSYATVLEQQVESLQQHVTSQQEVLDLVETEMDRLRAENQTQSHEIARLGRENGCQKELVREKTVEVNALKEQICMMDVENSKRRECSEKVREGEDQLRVLNKLRKEIKALKRSGTGSRQRSTCWRKRIKDWERRKDGKRRRTP
ncbi:DnaJ-domain-containing protein [Neurospora hispaniola]|uniref:DnaJ-domain-containing protein n=1 Tax=Neurospora hispaniola TaxID=588809 RepID=A0AAJ0I9D6_9PEZI|nr:DnaJ-domain-containing protein [Neurospora hispaniola]